MLQLLHGDKSALRDYKINYGPGYAVTRPEKKKIRKYSVYPGEKDHGEGGYQLLQTYVEEVVGVPRPPKRQGVDLDGLTEDFKQAEFLDQVNHVAIQNVPLQSQVSVQRGLIPNHSTTKRKTILKICAQLKKNDGQLVRVRLTNEGLDDSLIKLLASALARNIYLQQLMIHKNAITDYGMELLCDSLKWHPSFHTLWIGWNKITDVGVKHFAKLMYRNHNVKEVNISNKWPSVVWSQNDIELHPHVSIIGADYIVRALRKGSGLTSLSLADQRLRDTGANALFNCLQSCSLRALNLQANQLSDQCTQKLGSALSGSPILEKLILSKNNIGNIGAINIAAGLENNSILKVLNLDENKIDFDGLDALYACVLNHNFVLTSLITMNNKHEDARAEALVAGRNPDIFDSLSLPASQAGSRVRAASGENITEIIDIGRRMQHNFLLDNPYLDSATPLAASTDSYGSVDGKPLPAESHYQQLDGKGMDVESSASSVVADSPMSFSTVPLLQRPLVAQGLRVETHVAADDLPDTAASTIGSPLVASKSTAGADAVYVFNSGGGENGIQGLEGEGTAPALQLLASQSTAGSLFSRLQRSSSVRSIESADSAGSGGPGKQKLRRSGSSSALVIAPLSKSATSNFSTGTKYQKKKKTLADSAGDGVDSADGKSVSGSSTKLGGLSRSNSFRGDSDVKGKGSAAPAGRTLSRAASFASINSDTFPIEGEQEENPNYWQPSSPGIVPRVPGVGMYGKSPLSRSYRNLQDVPSGDSAHGDTGGTFAGESGGEGGRRISRLGASSGDVPLTPLTLAKAAARAYDFDRVSPGTGSVVAAAPVAVATVVAMGGKDRDSVDAVSESASSIRGAGGGAAQQVDNVDSAGAIDAGIMKKWKKRGSVSIKAPTDDFATPTGAHVARMAAAARERGDVDSADGSSTPISRSRPSSRNSALSGTSTALSSTPPQQQQQQQQKQSSHRRLSAANPTLLSSSVASFAKSPSHQLALVRSSSGAVGSPSAAAAVKGAGKTSKELGKTMGIPDIRNYGVKPIRSAITPHADSGQHVIYLRVATPYDPPDERPYSLVKIAMDRKVEIERVRKERQTEQYKMQKQLALFVDEKEKKLKAGAKSQQAAAPRVPDKFWKDWNRQNFVRYSKGMDNAAGTSSNRLPTYTQKLSTVNDLVDAAYLGVQRRIGISTDSASSAKSKNISAAGSSFGASKTRAPEPLPRISAVADATHQQDVQRRASTDSVGSGTTGLSNPNNLKLTDANTAVFLKKGQSLNPGEEFMRHLKYRRQDVSPGEILAARRKEQDLKSIARDKAKGLIE